LEIAIALKVPGAVSDVQIGRCQLPMNGSGRGLVWAIRPMPLLTNFSSPRGLPFPYDVASFRACIAACLKPDEYLDPASWVNHLWALKKLTL
jgi:hypothetical protein